MARTAMDFCPERLKVEVLLPVKVAVDSCEAHWAGACVPPSMAAGAKVCPVPLQAAIECPHRLAGRRAACTRSPKSMPALLQVVRVTPSSNMLRPKECDSTPPR